MKKALLATVAAAALGFGGAAYATPIYLSNGLDFESNGSNATSALNSVGFNASLATSVYLGNPRNANTTVVDTNMSTVLNPYGFSSGISTNISGTALQGANGNMTSALPAGPDQLNINSLNKVTGTNLDANGFTSGESTPLYGQNFGSGIFWGLTYDYSITGKTVDVDDDGLSDLVNFTSGFFKIFYENGTTRKQVLTLNLTGSTTSPNNLNLVGKIDFSFAAADDTFVQNFWKDASPGGVSFYDKWLNDPAAITWTLNTNVNPPIPTNEQLFRGSFGQEGPLFRQSELSGTISFDVPEPATLALMGLALAGAGVVSRRRKQA